jgi:TetR/AcrR family transcriptional regulator, cholesterol catabolism regulator
MMAKRNDRRKAILAVARKLFSEKGYHGASLGDIAEQAGLSVGLIYYVFPKKEDILLGLVQEGSILYREVFENVQNIASPVERFDTVVRELYRTLDNSSRVMMILYKDLSSINKETRQQILSMERETNAKIVAIIEDGKRSGAFKQTVSSQLVAFNVIGAGHLWSLKKTWLFGKTPLAEFIEGQLVLFHSMLLV